ncbi:MAG: ribulose-phosphate 3-epimerase [Defluviitaleaceae bacterium]|nr:ribulose-phosphate 3-epimerase [Defluviitaleaceae bacterium]
MNILAPSLLSANFANLERDIALLEQSGITYLHIDVMDGQLVPNISIGIPVVESLRPITNMVFDCHLMILHPSKYIDAFAKAGADIITFHVDVAEDIQQNLNQIKKLGKKAGLVINAHIAPQTAQPYLQQIDMVTVMSVQAGFGGQKFMPSSLEKIAYFANQKKERNLSYDIQVDGGINLQNVEAVLSAGVNVVVAGSSVFNTKDTAEAISNFMRCL